MDMAIEIAKMVMETRSGGGTIPTAVLDEAQQILSMQSQLCIETFVVHERCQHSPNANCINAELVELWTILLKKNCSLSDKTLEVLFLKNAVRSHLHFSQLNSWITNNDGKLPNELICAYRLSMNEKLSLGENREEKSSYEVHKFPLVRCDTNTYLFVQVEWYKRDAPPQLKPCIPFNDYRCGSEEWLLPNAYTSMCSSLSSLSHSFSSPSASSLLETPHFFISPDDDIAIDEHRNHHNLSPTNHHNEENSDNGDNDISDNNNNNNTSDNDYANDNGNDESEEIALQKQQQQHQQQHNQQQQQQHEQQQQEQQQQQHQIIANTNFIASQEQCKKRSSPINDSHLPQTDDSQQSKPTAAEQKRTSSVQAKHDGTFDCDGATNAAFVQTPPTNKQDNRNNAMMNCERVMIGSTEVESLADFLAASSSVSPLTSTPCASVVGARRESLPRRSQIAAAFRSMSSAPMVFSKTTGLPLNSSPAPLTRNERSFGSDKYHHTLNGIRKADETETDDDRRKTHEHEHERPFTARSAPTSSGLLCNFEESALNGRLEPLAALDGFVLEIAASGQFCAPHCTLTVTTFFFNLSDDDAPSPYLGHCSLEQFGRKGYHIPKKGTFQATLFNPQGTVVRIFMVRYDVSEMPPSSQTFIRQRTFFMPAGCPIEKAQRSWLKYLIHLRLATDRRGRLYVHTDIRMLFSQKGDLEALNIELEKESKQKYELLSFTEMPQQPRFSPRK